MFYSVVERGIIMPLLIISYVNINSDHTDYAVFVNYWTQINMDK